MEDPERKRSRPHNMRKSALQQAHKRKWEWRQKWMLWAMPIIVALYAAIHALFALFHFNPVLFAIPVLLMIDALIAFLSVITPVFYPRPEKTAQQKTSEGLRHGQRQTNHTKEDE